MPYLSPGTLFGGALPNPLDKRSIQLQRKKLLAELDLNASETIELSGHTWSKSDIIDYFETLQQDDALPYHQAIAEDPVLLGFLQDGRRFLPKDRFIHNPLYTDPGFLSWISPYYYDAFIGMANSCFQQIDDAGLENLLANPLLMTEYDQERAWIQIGNILQNNISLIEHYKNKLPEKTDLGIDDVSPLMSHLYVLVIQKLPYNRFGGIRDKYAFAIMQAAIYTFNKSGHNRSLTEIWMDNALSVAVSESIKQQLQAKMAEMSSIRKKAEKPREFPRFIWLALVILIKLLTCKSFRSQSTSGPSPIHHNQQTQQLSYTTAIR